MLGYKKCCSTDKNYDKESALSCKLAISKMIFPSETNEEIEFKGTLLECDLFSVLVSYIYYYDGECKIEEFDRLVQILFAAKLLQTVLNPCTEEIQSSEENMDITSLHPNVIEFLQLIVNIVPDICKIEDITSFNQNISFLRKVYILRHTLYDVFFSSLPDESSPFSDLCEVLIHNPQTISNLDQLLQSWYSSTPKDQIRSTATFAPFTFIELPKQYSFAYDKKFTNFICCNCNGTPSKPALCLICGTIVCAESGCCSENSFGECNTHMRKCGSVGVYLLLYSTMILLLQNGKGCFWGSIYVDEHGEIDKNLTRGKELHLSEVKLRELTKLCANLQIGKVCQSKQAKSRTLVLWERF